jgi:hypothetical protein
MQTAALLLHRGSGFPEGSERNAIVVLLTNVWKATNLQRVICRRRVRVAMHGSTSQIMVMTVNTIYSIQKQQHENIRKLTESRFTFTN